jgi:hypothetical protein
MHNQLSDPQDVPKKSSAPRSRPTVALRYSLHAPTLKPQYRRHYVRNEAGVQQDFSSHPQVPAVPSSRGQDAVEVTGPHAE